MDPLLRTALAAADAAARVHRRRAATADVSLATEKAPSDFVSEADHEAQEAALAVIGARHPDHRVLAEEGEGPGAFPGDGPVWIVDPLDGTTNFLHRHPLYAASVAVVVDGEPVAGAVVCSTTGERWWAVKGGGAWKGGRPVRVSPPGPLRTALVGTGFPFKALELLPGYLGQLGRVLESSSGVRRGGSAALDLAWLASGSLDAFWELTLKPWDVAAGVLLVREAGGVLTRVDGSPLTVLDEGSVLGAATPELLKELERVLEGTAAGAP